MIKVRRKPFEEITSAIERYKNILIIGCGGCASVCLGGGLNEVKGLEEDLKRYFSDKKFFYYVIERACNEKFFDGLEEHIKDKNPDSILCMCCSAGTQLIAETFSKIPVYPAVNTVAIAFDVDVGLFKEVCRACGNCIIGYTGGICPITRCSKSLFNGPCGGMMDGHCEVDPNTPCAWHEIYERLKEQGRLEELEKIFPIVEWRNQVPQVIIQYGYEDRYVKK